MRLIPPAWFALLLLVTGCRDDALVLCDTGPADHTGDTDTEPVGLDESLQMLRPVKPDHNLTCPESDLSTVFPLPGETDHWPAVRLTPKPQAADFVVEEVRYRLRYYPPLPAGGLTIECDATLDHEVRIWAQADDEPLAEPSLTQRVLTRRVAAGGAPGEDRDLRLLLHDEDLVVPEGQHLFVAVQNNGAYVGDEGLVTCIAACNQDGAFLSEQNLWAYSADEPFDWNELKDDWNINFWLDVEARGHAMP